MPNTTTTLVAVFDSHAAAENAKRELIREGFSEEEVQFINAGTFASDAASGNTALIGNTSAHSTGHGMGGWFGSMFGFDTEDFGHFSEALQRGGTAITVRTDEAQADRASRILNQYGAIDVDETAEGYREERLTGTEYVAGDRAAMGGEAETTIPVVEEELAVGKRAVKRGAVRVISTVVEKPVEEEVTLREETVRVDRRPVNRPATEADFATASTTGAIEMTETREEAVVSKHARVIEEVVVGKETTERTETIRDTIRRTDVQVEETGEKNLPNTRKK
jgi:uncharacterized protein (TIGR02271 family)